VIRTAMWFLLWLISLGSLTIDALYDDGLHVYFKGWVKVRKP
jgi:hypothetical protein